MWETIQKGTGVVALITGVVLIFFGALLIAIGYYSNRKTKLFLKSDDYSSKSKEIFGKFYAWNYWGLSGEEKEKF